MSLFCCICNWVPCYSLLLYILHYFPFPKGRRLCSGVESLSRIPQYPREFRCVRRGSCRAKVYGYNFLVSVAFIHTYLLFIVSCGFKFQMPLNFVPESKPDNTKNLLNFWRNSERLKRSRWEEELRKWQKYINLCPRQKARYNGNFLGWLQKTCSLKWKSNPFCALVLLMTMWGPSDLKVAQILHFSIFSEHKL